MLLEEMCTFMRWLQSAGWLAADHDNKLTGPDAVKFFERSGLPRQSLAKVWALSDNARRGFLDFKGFKKASSS